MITAVEIGNEMLTATKVRPMNKEESTIMLQLVVIEQKEKFKMPTENVPFVVELMMRRLKWAHVPVDDSVICFAGSLCDRPGTAVLYCAALKALYEKNSRQVAMDDFVKGFPMGFPMEEELNRIWEMQKVPSEGSLNDNALDRHEAWGFPFPEGVE